METKKSDYLELLDSFCSTVTNPKDLLEKVKLAWKNDAYISNGPESLSDKSHDGVYISSAGIYNYKKAVDQTPAKFVKIT